MGFNDLILIEPVPMSALDRGDEIEEIARAKLADKLQRRLRTTLDPGHDLRSAVRAQAVRVVPDGERFVVSHEDQAAVVKPATAASSTPPPDPNQVTDIDQLFQPSSGVPSVVDGKLVYRTITPVILFGSHKEEAQAQLFEQTVTAVLREEVVNSYEEAIAEVSRQHLRSR